MPFTNLEKVQEFYSDESIGREETCACKARRNRYVFPYFSSKIRRKILSRKVWLNLKLFTANKSQRSSIVPAIVL